MKTQNLGARWGGWSTPGPSCFTPGKNLVPTVQEAGWAPGPVWTGVENLAPTRNQSPDRPVCSESLYQLRCPGGEEKTSVKKLFLTTAGTVHYQRQRLSSEHRDGR
jgi:hypothetical protein